MHKHSKGPEPLWHWFTLGTTNLSNDMLWLKKVVCSIDFLAPQHVAPYFEYLLCICSDMLFSYCCICKGMLLTVPSKLQGHSSISKQRPVEPS